MNYHLKQSTLQNKYIKDLVAVGICCLAISGVLIWCYVTGAHVCPFARGTIICIVLSSQLLCTTLLINSP